MSDSDLAPGIYEHYKGNKYQVYEVAQHSETNEKLVVYRPLYGKRGLSVRPLDMFAETVMTSAGERPRFKFVEAKEESAL